ncbi:hypothetical protein NQU59_11150 [Acinetobacter colistiniresistens]|uniref:hypothetical protein n=1 Tax=Acinetobacter colistiniresistens TaxID=280145 RepID=UPI00211C5CAF|nr:hypothetical protein [Acinetobacter colistiniresistens]UUM29303.1 hypothetical protein NQU59_11150 [Acinetobacter colistiniresistens]
MFALASAFWINRSVAREIASYYGLAPHIHTKPIDGTVFLDEPFPENFSPDEDGLGVYTHCLNCGGDGTYDGVVLEPKADAEES